MQKEVTQKKYWCSWCFEQREQVVLSKKLFGRDLCMCSNCCNESNFCTLCAYGMSRSTVDGADKLCAKCDGTIDKWGAYPSLQEEGPCSWCFETTKHTLMKKNYVRRNIYECDSCRKRTLKCRMCQQAFVRGSITYDNELCLVCDCTVDDWKDPAANRAKLTCEAWCSWCVARTKHVQEEINTVRRTVYRCEECDGRSLPCTTCFPKAMARGASGWDDDECLHCQSDTLKDWEEFEQHKQEVFEKHTPGLAADEMRKESEYRTKALKVGMIRAFLLLVGMSPKLRNQVACYLGWSMIPQSYFGDSHAESWEIISRSGSGMMARSASIASKLKITAKPCTYYEIIRQVAKEIFYNAPGKDKPHNVAYVVSCQHGDADVLMMEEFIMTQVHAQQRRTMTREQRREEDALIALNTEEMQRVKDKVREKAKLHDRDAMKYALGVVKSAVHAPGEWGLTLMSLQALQTALPATAAYVGPAVLGITALMGPLAIIGMVGMVTKGVSLALGPSLARLYGPLVLMVDQRVLMAMQGTDIDTFY